MTSDLPCPRKSTATTRYLLSKYGNCQIQSLESAVQPCRNIRFSPVPASVKNSFAVDPLAAIALGTGMAATSAAAAVCLSQLRRDIPNCCISIDDSPGCLMSLLDLRTGVIV